MTGLEWFLIFALGFVVLSYHRASVWVWAMSFALLSAFYTRFSDASIFGLLFVYLLLCLVFIPLLILPLRRRFFSQPILNFYRTIMPTMSRTEQEALAAGTVTWEGDLFSGAPQWKTLLAMPKATLTSEEQDFLDGPVEVLCGMINDWDITHYRYDLPPEIWRYLAEQGFFGLIIPKAFGGKEFSAYAHSQILIKVYSVSATVATTISVPNSLGPAELLLHYGTAKQKSYYLPRLATGQEIPCFALTGPTAGSDAGAIPDAGVVCWGDHEGKKVLGIRLNFDKRYITLAPVATVIGLAFKLYDPDHLIGGKEKLGITCALIPRDTAGVSIGRRHYPLNIPFQNGPIYGKDVFIPLEWIIGGVERVGQGWQMLMECLAAGRAISLPASSVGGAKTATLATGAYARIRRQFNTFIGRFEGIEEVLARIAGHTYLMDATRTLAAISIDQGEKPAIASAIVKYHVTELGRQVSNDAMDVHGGKGICLGPKNYLGRIYESVPISITVEGANILTRSLIIFGQGAMRCHPYIFVELEAAKLADARASLIAFDKALIGHLGYSLSNWVRTLVLSLTLGYGVLAPRGSVQRYFQQATRFSAAFALLADLCLILLGGELKRKESLSGRLGDILSQLYLLSAVLKRYYDQGTKQADLPLVKWAAQTCLHQIQEKILGLLQNFPIRFLGSVLAWMIFPWGKRCGLPSDALSAKVAQLVLAPTETRDRLIAGTYVGLGDHHHALALLEDALVKVIAAEPLEKIIRSAVRDDLISGDTLSQQATAALAKGLLSTEECHVVLAAEEARKIIIAVDDFSPEELMHRPTREAL